MPTHIDVLCGHYPSVVEWNGRAIEADRKYLKYEGAENFYSLYRCHDYHFRNLWRDVPRPVLLLYCVVLLAVLAANVVAILLAATVARRRMHHD